MTSPNELPPIAAIPEGSSAETKASAAASYRKAGYSDETLAAAGYGPAAQPTVNMNVQLATHPNGGTFMRNDGISHDQAVAAAKHLIAHGVDPTIVASAALAHGLTPEELAYTPPSKEAVATIARDADVAQGFAPPPEGKYELQFERSFAQARDAAELAALNKDIQSAFKSAEVPAALAQPLLDAILETAESYADKSVTEAGRQMRFKEEGALFNKTSRNPAEDARLANLGYSALPKAFRDQLDANFSLHSAKAQFQLAGLGRAIEYRRAGNGK